MLGGFDPRGEKLFFQRRRGGALLLAFALYAAVFVRAFFFAAADKTTVVQLEPEIRDFVTEEEPVVEEEPPPPPPPNTKVEVTKAPRPKPKIKLPDQKPQEAAPETNQEKTVGHPGGPTAPGGAGDGRVESKPKPKPVEVPKPKATPPKPKTAEEPIDPTKPVDRPERATMPKPEAGNRTPSYPEALRDHGITGEVVMKIHIHRDGTVRGAKILRKRSSAVTDEEKADAEKQFVAAAIAAIKTWKYEPAKLDGEPISIWFPVNFPFSLTGG